MSHIHTHKTRHWHIHLPMSVVITAALIALIAAVAGVAFLEMSHPLTAAILSIR